jgi:hypothetical protein
MSKTKERTFTVTFNISDTVELQHAFRNRGSSHCKMTIIDAVCDSGAYLFGPEFEAAKALRKG